MDLNGVEKIDFNALGGADTITVNDLSGTGVTQVDVNLAANGGAGDGAADTVIVDGTNGANTIEVLGSGTSFSVVGLPALVNVSGSEGANDTLVIKGLGGNDTISAATLPADVVKLTIDGGTGNDTMTGSAGDDILLGGDGNDLVFGGRGNDVALLGAGNDSFVWNPGDGSDSVDGQDGFDTLQFNGANIAEDVDIAANGTRALLHRDVANITMDLNGVERIDFNALGGADHITVGDMTGTGVTQVNIGLGGTLGSAIGDGVADTVTVNASAGIDQIAISSSGTAATISGLAATTTILGLDAVDSITVNGLGGDDVINGSASSFSLTLNGGAGADVITGGQNNDVVNGGTGNDVALMGGGDDTFVWNPGDGSDTVEGQAGIDTLQFNGANIAEQIDISANGGHARFTRDIAGITMDLNDVEHIAFKALGGADTIHVQRYVRDRRDGGEHRPRPARAGAGDGSADTIIIDAHERRRCGHCFRRLPAASQSSASAPRSTSRVSRRRTIGSSSTALAGDDVIEASGLQAGSIQLTADGGDGNDIILGGAGNDTLFGGPGDDVLIGGGGTDVIDGGPGDNIVIQSLIAEQQAAQLV